MSLKNRIPVVCIYEDGTHREYESIVEAARNEHVSEPTVSSLIRTCVMGTCKKIFVPKSEFFEYMCNKESIQSAKDAHYAGSKTSVTGIDQNLEFHEYASLKNASSAFHTSTSTVLRWCQNHYKRFGMVWFKTEELDNLKMSELQVIMQEASNKYCPRRYK